MIHCSVYFRADLTSPATAILLGKLAIAGDTFEGFTWSVDPRSFGNGYIGELVASTPSMLRCLIEEDWPREQEDGATGDVVAYLHRALGLHASIFIG